MADRCILLFVKYPEVGRVKKRLAVRLDAAITSELYKNFVMDLLSTLEGLRIPLIVCFSPRAFRDRFSAWLGQEHQYMAQRGKDLGERMKHAFNRAFRQHFREAILIGSDSPDLPGNLIAKAFSSLDGHDSVVGPSRDGGYYLIGFRRDTFLPGAFDGVSWSTREVFHHTLTILRREGQSVQILPQWNDVDTFDDLRDLIRRNQDTPFRSSKTMTYLSHCEYTFT